MNAKEQRAALLSDPKRFERAKLAFDAVNLIYDYVDQRNVDTLDKARKAIDILEKLDENPEIHTPRCIIY